MATPPTRIIAYEDFVKVHGILLAASGLPRSLHRELFEKLTSETLDGGSYFQVEPCEDGRKRRLILTSQSMPKDSGVFLVDHAWTFRLSDAYKQLLEVPGLAERMATLMCVDLDIDSDEDETEENLKLSVEEVVESVIRDADMKGQGSVSWLELEELAINDDKLLSLDLPSKFPDLVALSLYGNELENMDIVAEVVTKFQKLRALWLNNNLLIQKCNSSMVDRILQECPSLEIFNSDFTYNFGKWALGFAGGIVDKDHPCFVPQFDHPLQDVTALDLSNRSIQNLISKAFTPVEMPNLSHLNIRGNTFEDNSCDELLEVLRMFPCLTSLELDIPGPLGESAVEILESLPKLSLLNSADASTILEFEKDVIDSILEPRLPEWTAGEPLPNRVINAMWLYLMNYRLADEEKIDETSVWYVMDELGSALRHSDEPNFRIAPFLFMPYGEIATSVSYSILWPIHDIKKGDECTRDFLLGIGKEKQRAARLTAWFHTPKSYFIRAYEKHTQKLQTKNLVLSSTNACAPGNLRNDGRKPLCVYTDIPQVEEYLSRPEFEYTTDPKDADIIWTCMQLDEDTKSAIGIKDQQYINQFPFEACLVMKHHLAETIQKACGSPEWLQPTYNLETHLSQLIGDYYARQRDGRNNLLILKPWNMARTIDTSVTDDLSSIIRLMETGPKICQKYIEHPALSKGRKFDLRYIVLVRSMDPLEIFLSDVFWVRMANNQYSLEKHSFFEYETHFTVMNYRGTLNHINTSDFVREFEQEHQVKWPDIHQTVKNMIRSVFECAAVVHPQKHSSMSRAMYGLDVMLDSSFQPKLLEVTYCPDCTRACQYDMKDANGELVKANDFFNNVFGCLFLNETKHVTRL